MSRNNKKRPVDPFAPKVDNYEAPIAPAKPTEFPALDTEASEVIKQLMTTPTQSLSGREQVQMSTRPPIQYPLTEAEKQHTAPVRQADASNTLEDIQRAFNTVYAPGYDIEKVMFPEEAEPVHADPNPFNAALPKEVPFVNSYVAPTAKKASIPFGLKEDFREENDALLAQKENSLKEIMKNFKPIGVASDSEDPRGTTEESTEVEEAKKTDTRDLTDPAMMEEYLKEQRMKNVYGEEDRASMLESLFKYNLIAHSFELFGRINVMLKDMYTWERVLVTEHFNTKKHYSDFSATEQFQLLRLAASIVRFGEKKFNVLTVKEQTEATREASFKERLDFVYTLNGITVDSLLLELTKFEETKAYIRENIDKEIQNF